MWLATIRKVFASCDGTDGRETEISSQVEQYRLHLMKLISSKAKHAVALSAASYVIRSQWQWMNGTDNLTAINDLTRWTLWLAAMLGGELYPDWFTIRAVKLVTFCAVTRLSLVMYAASSPFEVVTAGESVIMVTVVLHFALGSSAFTISSSAAMCFMACHAYWLQLSNDRNEEAMRIFGSWVQRRLQAEVLIVLMGDVFNSGLRALVEYSLESKESQQLRATVETLLSVLCDATLTMDADFRLVAPAPRLEAMLLGSRALQDRSFVEMMPAEDAERFRKHVTQVGHHDHTASLTVNLRGSSDVLVAVKLFHVPFTDFWTSQPQYLVGITELGGLETACPLQSSLDEADTRCFSTIQEGGPTTWLETASMDGSVHSRESADLKVEAKHRVILKSKALALEDFKETPQETVEQLICLLLVRMNVRGKGCCFWHIALTYLEHECKRMLRGSCFSGFEPQSKWQCAECRAMNPVNGGDCAIGDECDICGEEFFPASHAVFY